LLNLIEDIETALLSNNMRCALGMALTLPDICGQIESPNEENVGKRYRKWCRKFLFNQGHHSHIPLSESISDSKQRVISPEVCYKLRCAYLHSGNLELNQKEWDNFPEFRLIITHPEDEGIYVESVSNGHYMTVDIRHLTKVICNAAKEYYNNHTTKEDFQSKHIHVIDVTNEAEKARGFFEQANDIMNRESNLFDYDQLTDGAKNLLENIKKGCADVSVPSRDNGEITQEDITLMCQYIELLKGGFLIHNKDM
jgi:hypothetical protein